MPRYFGTRHLGSIRGFVASVSVGSTAFGPVLFATGFQATGSYTPVLLGSAVAPAVVAALLVKPPRAGSRSGRVRRFDPNFSLG